MTNSNSEVHQVHILGRTFSRVSKKVETAIYARLDLPKTNLLILRWGELLL